MLRAAFDKIPGGTGLVLHSDQGWQYRMDPYQNMMIDKRIQQSMSREGNCLSDNVMGNFIGLLKSELLYLQAFEFMEDFKEQLEDYIEYYNHRRIKVKLKGMSPVDYRTHSFQVA